MKKILIFAMLSLVMVACSQEDPVVVPDKPKSESSVPMKKIWGSGEILPADISAYKKIATKLVESDLTLKICAEVRTIVQNTKEVGLGEACYIKEAVSDSAKMWWPTPLSSTPRFLRDILVFDLEDPKTENIYITADILQTVQIYWPYSENWDGVTMPVITWYGEKCTDVSNYAYYKENGEIKAVVVDDAFAQKYPVWIINSAKFPYSSIPALAKTETDETGNQKRTLNADFNISVGTYSYQFKKGMSVSVDGTSGSESSTIRQIVDEEDVTENSAYKILVGNFYVPRSYVTDFFAGNVCLTINIVTLDENQNLVPATQVVTINNSDIGKTISLKYEVVNKWLPRVNNMLFSVHQHKGSGAPTYFAGNIEYEMNSIKHTKTAAINYYAHDNIIFQKNYNRTNFFINDIIKNKVVSSQIVSWQFYIEQYL